MRHWEASCMRAKRIESVNNGAPHIQLVSKVFSTPAKMVCTQNG